MCAAQWSAALALFESFQWSFFFVFTGEQNGPEVGPDSVFAQDNPSQTERKWFFKGGRCMMKKKILIKIAMSSCIAN